MLLPQWCRSYLIHQHAYFFAHRFKHPLPSQLKLNKANSNTIHRTCLEFADYDEVIIEELSRQTGTAA